jgi:hypothetical protein
MGKLMTTVLMVGLMAIAISATRADAICAADGVFGSITYNVCSPNTPVSADGSFNIDVTCPLGQTVVTGGYSCSYNSGANLLPVIVSVNTFFGYPTPNGWQTIGQTLASADVTNHTFACVNKSSGEVKIVAKCTVGTNATPCHANDTCTDLSGQSTPPVITNPTCQVCISCFSSPAC